MNAVHVVTGVLLHDRGFLLQQTTGVFDKGLDLLVMPCADGQALPAIAALQVKGGDSQRSIRVGNHLRYWSEMPMPVFGVVVPTNGAAFWVNLRAYLRAHPKARAVKPMEPLATLPAALRDAYNEHSGVLSLINLGSPEAGSQLAALLALRPLRDRAEVVALVRGRLARLAPLPTRLALELLWGPASAGSSMAPLWAEELVLIAEHVQALSFGEVGDGAPQMGEGPEDSWRWGRRTCGTSWRGRAPNPASCLQLQSGPQHLSRSIYAFSWRRACSQQLPPEPGLKEPF